MQILGTGLDYSTGEPLVTPMDEDTFGAAIREALAARADEIGRAAAMRSRGVALRGEARRERTADLGDPRDAGWTFMVHRDDPRRGEIERILSPLAEHRGLTDPDPLLFDGSPPEDWQAWMQDQYFGRQFDGRRVPQFVLIVGGPDLIPFHFQALFDSAASVGRVDFASLDDLRAYVDKLLRLEQASAPVTDREALFFATDAGEGDATFFSRRFMVEPLARQVSRAARVPAVSLVAEEAEKPRLLESGRTKKPALVYLATHGLAAPKEPLDVQKRVNGGICCQHLRGHARDSWLVTADDVPADTPFFEGAAVFQFACFGYGTPSESEFRHWFGKAGLNSPETFLAALPQKLLAHPRGPIAFIGHLDTAWVHGFADPAAPALAERWSSRLAPYKGAVETLLACQPVGLAMTDMNKRFDYTNAELTLTLDRLVRGRLEMTPALHARLATTFIFRTDAQNYMVFGDPAARLRMPAAR